MKTVRTVRLTLVREPSGEYNKPMRHAGDIYSMLKPMIGDEPREVFCAVYMDTKNRIVAMHRVSTGTADTATVHPREVFGPAVQLAATSIVVAHNHPSGDPTPSANDHAVTNRLKAAGELLGIEVLDHIIIGDGRYYTCADQMIHIAR